MYIKTRIFIWEILLKSWKLELLILAVVSLVTILYINYFNQYIKPSGILVTVLGTAISFFIGFINAQAYDRWWEARKIWGAIVNDSRSFARMVLSFLAKPEDSKGNDEDLKILQKKLVFRHLGFLYALKERLRGEDNKEYLNYLDDDDKKKMEGALHIPNNLLLLQGKEIDSAEKSNYMDVFRMVRLNEMLNNFSDHMGQAERIKTTIFPVYYSSLIRMAIWLYLLIFPMTISEMVGYWSIVLSYLLGIIFILTFRAGQTLLNPFEGKPSDTPMSTITRTIEINLLEQIGEKNIPDPLQPINGLYLL